MTGKLSMASLKSNVVKVDGGCWTLQHNTMVHGRNIFGKQTKASWQVVVVRVALGELRKGIFIGPKMRVSGLEKSQRTVQP